jgi:hypothetical protein
MNTGTRVQETGASQPQPTLNHTHTHLEALAVLLHAVALLAVAAAAVLPAQRRIRLDLLHKGVGVAGLDGLALSLHQAPVLHLRGNRGTPETTLVKRKGVTIG